MNEDQNTEWKASWRDEYLKWLCGFANAQGGVLEVGRNDAGQVVRIGDAARLMEELPNKLRDLLGIVADINHLDEGGRSYLRIVVEPYPVPISYKGEYYYRSGSTKQILKGAALDRFLLSKTGKCWDAVPVPNVGVNDLDVATLVHFRERATRANRLGMSVLKEDDSGLVEKLRLMENQYLKRAAVLLFHPDPERFFTGASIKVGYFDSETELRYHDEVCGDLFTQVSKAMDLLTTKYLKAVISYEGVQRIETYPVPESALREAVLNAVVHRDYAVAAQIQIRVYADRLKIWNPGELPGNWSLEKLLGQHPSQPFNPDIANAFFRAGEIESWGRGILRIFEACQQAGTPEPAIQVEPHVGVEFMFSESYVDGIGVRTSGVGDTVVATGGRIRKNLGRTAQETAQETTQETTQEKILASLRAYPELTRKALAARIGITPDSGKTSPRQSEKSRLYSPCRTDQEGPLGSYKRLILRGFSRWLEYEIRICARFIWRD